jgi:hypothetical protein
MHTITILLMAWSFFAQPRPDRVLRVGESTSFTIKAVKLYNEPGLQLIKGAKYEITAKGNWKDGSCKETDANGFLTSECKSSLPGVDILMSTTEGLRRAGSQRWFCLMGEIFDSSCNAFDNATADQQFRVGASRIFTPAVSGKLILFANDVITAYGNNTGQLTVTIKRTS